MKTDGPVTACLFHVHTKYLKHR